MMIGEIMEVVNSFKYLGSDFKGDGGLLEDLKRYINTWRDITLQ